MKNNYNDCLTRLLKDEGGYTNDPSDSGGATNFGITIKDYRLYINKNGTPLDVKNMTVDQAKTIYKSKYWDALNCDTLKSGVDYTCFDYGVNSGLGRPRKALAKFNSLSGPDLIKAINDERRAFLKQLEIDRPKDKKYDAGWMARVSRVNDYSLQLAKKNNTSGPIIGTVVATGTVAASTHPTFWSHITSHPYLSVMAVSALAIGVGMLVHYFVNKGK